MGDVCSVLIGLLSIALIGSVFIGWSQWREGFEAGVEKSVREGRGIDSPAFHAELAELLDLQADGGDSAAAHLAWAIETSRKRVKGSTP